MAPIPAPPAIELGRDSYEQEAVRVAERVTHMPVPRLQRTCKCGGRCSECSADRRPAAGGLMRARSTHSAPEANPASGLERGGTRAGALPTVRGPALPPIVTRVIHRSGTPLDRRTRAYMEPRLGTDLSSVRVHTGGTAARSTHEVGARAYTVGHHIVFDRGLYQPDTAAGRLLLAHELVHVLQQSPGLVGGTSQRTLSGSVALQRAVPPALAAALAVIVAAGVCGLPYHLYALRTYGRKSDKWRHCWVSCEMSRTCGPLLTQVAGLGKEIRDRAIAGFCHFFPTNSLCAGGHADFLDSLRDLAANQACISWETYLVGPLARFWRQSCRDCCDASGL